MATSLTGYSRYESQLQLEDAASCFFFAQILEFNQNPYKQATHRATKAIMDDNLNSHPSSPDTTKNKNKQTTSFEDDQLGLANHFVTKTVKMAARNIHDQDAAAASTSTTTTSTTAKFSSILNTKNVLFHEAVRSVIGPQNIKGPDTPQQFKDKVRALSRKAFAGEDGVFKHVETCCSKRSMTDAVGFIIEVATDPRNPKQRDVIGGAIVALVDSEDEYFRGGRSGSCPGQTYDSPGFGRVWMPFLIVSMFSQYDQQVLADRFIKNILAVVSKLASRNAFGEFLTGIDCRTPLSSFAKRSLTGAGFENHNKKTLSQTHCMSLTPLRKKEQVQLREDRASTINIDDSDDDSSDDSDDDENESDDDSSSSSSSSAAPVKKRPGRPRKTNSASSRSNSAKPKAKNQSSKKMKPQPKGRRPVSKKMLKEDESADDESESESTDDESDSEEESEDDQPQQALALDESTLRLCQQLPDGVGGIDKLIQFRLAHEDDATEIKGIFSGVARDLRQDLRELVDKSFSRTDARFVAYLPQPEFDEANEREFFRGEVTNNNNNSRKSVPFRSAASFTPNEEYVNRYNNQDDAEKACRLFDGAKRKYTNNNSNNNNNCGDANFLNDNNQNEEQVKKSVSPTFNGAEDPETLPIDEVVARIREAHAQSNNRSTNNNNIIVGFISIESNGHISFVWVHPLLRKRRIATVLVGIAAEWLRVRQLIITYADTYQAYPGLAMGKIKATKKSSTSNKKITSNDSNSVFVPYDLDENALRWISLGEKWDLFSNKFASTSSSSLLPQITPEMQKLIDAYDAHLDQKRTEFRSQAVVIPTSRNAAPKIIISASGSSLINNNNNNNVKMNGQHQHHQPPPPTAANEKKNISKANSSIAIPASSANGQHRSIVKRDGKTKDLNNKNATDEIIANRSFGGTFNGVLANTLKLRNCCMELLFGRPTTSDNVLLSSQQHRDAAATTTTNATSTNNNKKNQNVISKTGAAPPTTTRKNVTIIKKSTTTSINSTTTTTTTTATIIPSPSSTNKVAVLKSRSDSSNPWSKEDTRISSTSPDQNDVAFLKSRLVTRFSLPFGRKPFVFRNAGDPFVASEREAFPPSCGNVGPHPMIFVPCVVQSQFDEKFGGVFNCHSMKFPTIPEGRTEDGIKKLSTIERVYLLSCLKQITTTKSYSAVNSTGSVSEPSSPVTTTVMMTATSTSTSNGGATKFPRITMDFDPIPPALLLASSAQKENIKRNARFLTPANMSALEVSLTPLSKNLCALYEKMGFTYDISEDIRERYKNDPAGLRRAVFGVVDGVGNKKGKNGSGNAAASLGLLSNQDKAPQMTRTVQLFSPQLPCALGDLVPQLDFDFLGLIVADWKERVKQRDEMRKQQQMEAQAMQQQQQRWMNFQGENSTTERAFLSADSGQRRERQ